MSFPVSMSMAISSISRWWICCSDYLDDRFGPILWNFGPKLFSSDRFDPEKYLLRNISSLSTVEIFLQWIQRSEKYLGISAGDSSPQCNPQIFSPLPHFPRPSAPSPPRAARAASGCAKLLPWLKPSNLSQNEEPPVIILQFLLGFSMKERNHGGSPIGNHHEGRLGFLVSRWDIWFHSNFQPSMGHPDG